MRRFQQILVATTLTLSLSVIALGGTITGSRTNAVGTITGSRVGTITGSKAGTITGSRADTITGSRGDTVGENSSETETTDNWLSRALIVLFNFYL